jgi:hypothetical protein
MISERRGMVRRLTLTSTCFLTIFFGCRNLVVTEPNQLYLDAKYNNENVADFEQAWSIADSIYPFFQFKHINWDSIHSVYEPLAEKANGDEIFNVLFNMFAQLKDAHQEIITHGGFPVQTYWPPPRARRDLPTFSPQIIRKYFTRELKVSSGGFMDYEILPEGFGYVRISTFTSGDWIFDFDGILDYLDSAKGLIIDVRQNDGGSSNSWGTSWDYVVSRFLSVPLPPSPVYYKGQQLSGSPLQPRGPYQYTKPVVVLINGVSFSATELFANMMSQLPNATLVGDTTGGGGGDQEIYLLPSGRQIRISVRDLRRYDNQPIEWNGVPPNIVVMQTTEDLQNGHDLQLERAIKLLQ